MDKISGLSDDELLVKILSFLPTKVAVSTSVLSRQWKDLWKRVVKVKLEFDDIESKTKSQESEKSFLRFVQRELQIHRDSALESLSLSSSTELYTRKDIKSWVGFAVSRGVRELSIVYSTPKTWKRPARLPETLCFCKSLVSLNLEGEVLMSFPSSPTRVCLPCLKTLRLRNVRFDYDEDLEEFLCSCTVLENLVLENTNGDSAVIDFSVTVPSLQRLSLEMISLIVDYKYNGYPIYTPCLKYFKIKVRDYYHPCLIANMPKLEEAYMDVECLDSDGFLKPITSVKRLSLCLRAEEDVWYTNEFFFDQLEHLRLCTCDQHWPRLIVQMLKKSPNLRILELYLIDKHKPSPTVSWKKHLSCDPHTSLETFKWTGCEGRQERDVVRYILNKCSLLKDCTSLD